MPEEQRIKAGVGVMIFKDGKVLMGKRKGSAGAGEYAPPGGMMDYWESFEACARREVREEAGIEIKNIRFLCVSNQKNYPPGHVVNIGFVADWESGEPQVLEPEKCESWEWYDFNHLPEPLFATVKTYLETLKIGKNYFDA